MGYTWGMYSMQAAAVESSQMKTWDTVVRMSMISHSLCSRIQRIMAMSFERQLESFGVHASLADSTDYMILKQQSKYIDLETGRILRESA